VLRRAIGALAVLDCGRTGLSSEEAIFLQIGAASVSLQGLLPGGQVIGVLGVLDGVTISPASTVMALRRPNPASRSGASRGARSTWFATTPPRR
jgi:uncharacterized membrane protein